jgi:hypothetical protein
MTVTAVPTLAGYQVAPLLDYLAKVASNFLRSILRDFLGSSQGNFLGMFLTLAIMLQTCIFRPGEFMAVAKGTEQIGVGIDSALVIQLRAFAGSRGETIRAVVEMALRRHMANPPPPTVPLPPPITPLPPVTASEPVAKPVAKKTITRKKGKT